MNGEMNEMEKDVMKGHGKMGGMKGMHGGMGKKKGGCKGHGKGMHGEHNGSIGHINDPPRCDGPAVPEIYCQRPDIRST